MNRSEGKEKPGSPLSAGPQFLESFADSHNCRASRTRGEAVFLKGKQWEQSLNATVFDLEDPVQGSRCLGKSGAPDGRTGIGCVVLCLAP